MNFKKRVNGSWTDTPHYIHNTSTDTITTLPAVLYPNDTTATVGLKGQTLQSSVPSPTSPVMPHGTGERTGNLFDAATAYGAMYSGGVITGQTNDINSIKNKVTADMIGKTYTISITPLQIPSRAYISIVINGAIYWRENELTVNQRSSFQFSPVTENDQWYITYDIGSVCSYKDIMVNEGSTAQPYEPYGFKIPMSSANATTPIYLGEVETTRKVKKLVLTGQESWNISKDTYYITVSNYYRMYDIGSHLSVCSHYPNIQLLTLPEMHYGLGGIIDGKTHTVWNGNIVFNPSPMILSLTDWRTYLAQQYANGTPVTVWYVLGTETTGIVNEPLMKIGDYADTLSNISIPVTAGANTISVDTTVQPSEVTVNYKGWHPIQSTHEYNSNYTIATIQTLTIAQLQAHTISELQGGGWL